MRASRQGRPKPAIHPLTFEVQEGDKWQDAQGRAWEVVERLPFGNNLCRTTDLRYVRDWTDKEIRTAQERAINV